MCDLILTGRNSSAIKMHRCYSILIRSFRIIFIYSVYWSYTKDFLYALFTGIEWL